MYHFFTLVICLLVQKSFSLSPPPDVSFSAILRHEWPQIVSSSRPGLGLPMMTHFHWSCCRCLGSWGQWGIEEDTGDFYKWCHCWTLASGFFRLESWFWPGCSQPKSGFWASCCWFGESWRPETAAATTECCRNMEAPLIPMGSPVRTHPTSGKRNYLITCTLMTGCTQEYKRIANINYYYFLSEWNVPKLLV